MIVDTLADRLGPALGHGEGLLHTDLLPWVGTDGSLQQVGAVRDLQQLIGHVYVDAGTRAMLADTDLLPRICRDNGIDHILTAPRSPLLGAQPMSESNLTGGRVCCTEGVAL